VSGAYLQNLNLPIDPDGVVYNSILRGPVPGTTLVMLRAATQAQLPASCFDDAAQQAQVTLASGYYKFDLNFSDPACPPGADYLIQATPPVVNYMTGLSGDSPAQRRHAGLPGAELSSRCARRAGRILRGAGLGVCAGDQRAGAIAGHGVLPERHPEQRQHSGPEPAVQQPHPG
jgi:hypothetical protein